MITKLFQFYDRTAESVTGPIITSHREGPAIREFHSVLANKNQGPGQYPDQFDLIQIGEQDTDTGIIKPVIRNDKATTEVVATGKRWREEQETQRELKLRLES